MRDIETQLCDLIDSRRDSIIGLTRDMVAFKSINPRFMHDSENSQESQLQDFVESQLRAMNLDVTRWEAEARRPNLVGIRGGAGGGRSLAFNGHIDVVPIGDLAGWDYDPWGADIADGKLYGRGTVDMKAGVAAFLSAAKAINDSDIQLRGDLQLHIVVDEEAGGFAGTRDVIKAWLPSRWHCLCRADERTSRIGPEGGLSWVRLTFRGRSAHAGWRFAQIYPQADPDAQNADGVNAIEKCVKFVAALREFEREWARTRFHPLMPPGLPTMNPGVMVGGVGLGDDGMPQITSNPAMVPDICVLDIDFKYLPCERFEDVRAEFEAFVKAFAGADLWLRANPPTVQWHLSNIDFPPFSTPEDHPLMTALRETHQSRGIETKLAGMLAVTDAAFYAGAGMTPIVLGPLGRRLAWRQRICGRRFDHRDRQSLCRSHSALLRGG